MTVTTRSTPRARILGIVLLVVVLASGLAMFLNRYLEVDMGWEEMDYAAIEEVGLLQSFLQIDTTHETGSELEGAEFLAAILREEGIPVEVLDMGEGRANLVATLEGDRPQALILHNHLDLDPIREPDAWIHPPFSGTIEPPWIYGRGAFDMKSVTIAQLVALVDLKRTGSRPSRTIRFLATSSEEAGSELGTLWLLKNRPDIFEGAWGLLTEGGVLEARSFDNIKYWGTEFSQKRFVRVIVRSPESERLEQLRAAILQRGPPGPQRVTPEVRRFLESYASSRDNGRFVELLSNPDELVADPSKLKELPGYLQGLFRDEPYPFTVVEDREGGFQLRITLGLLSDADVDEAYRRLLPEDLTTGLDVEVLMEPSSGEATDPDHALFADIERTLLEHYGTGTPNGPYYQGNSATDARFFRAWGIPSFGFTPFLALTTDTLAIGGPNEGIALPAFLAGVELYRELLRNVAEPPRVTDAPRQPD